MKTMAEYKADQRLRAKARGLCSVCCQNPTGSRSVCVPCTAQAKERYRKAKAWKDFLSQLS